MQRNLVYEEIFPCSLERLWRAITSPEELSRWLMPNDFAPVVGHRFHFEARIPEPHRIACEVRELEPPHRMLWSWRVQNPDAETEVCFELDSTMEKRTRLRLSHTGLPDDRLAELFANGWPGKLKALAEIVSAVN